VSATILTIGPGSVIGAFTPSIALTTDANTVLAISGELVDLTGRHTITNNGVAVSTDFPT
jgi:hypothetical protein